MLSNIIKSNIGQARIIDGKAIGRNILKEYKMKIESLSQKNVVRPGLAIIQIGDRQDSNIYIRNKLKAAKDVGIQTSLFKYNPDISKSELFNKIDELNNDVSINGIITQLPINNFNKFDYCELTDKVLPEKDVDCLNSENLEKIHQGNYKQSFLPCAVKACIEILNLIQADLKNKNIVIVGASKLIGVPLQYLFNLDNLTVTLCDDKTKNLQEICQQADVLIVAIGNSKFINGNYIKKGAIIIDIGINYDLITKKITGDVNFEEAIQKASFVTPVPGGVGPITVSMLMVNTYDSFYRFLNKKNYNLTP